MSSYIQASKCIRWLRAAVILPVLFVFFTCTLPAGEAHADGSTIDASCSQMQDWGFTAGIVYCVQKSIDSAVTLYVTAMVNSLRYYEGMMATVAVMFFAIQLMNQGVQEPRKELMHLVIRILIGVFCYENAVNIYHWLAGTLPGNTGFINEAIGWVTGTGSGGTGVNMFSNLVAGNCTVDTLPQNYGGAPVWQAFDCMFREILGAASPSKHPYAFSTSLLTIIAASLFSATTGVMIAAFGIQLFLSALLLVFRALYLVLMAYVCIGFMALFAPLVAPMFFFDSDYLRDKFKRWVGILVSCIFQPVLVVGFLAMAICIEDQFIEGTLPAPGCKLPTYPDTSGATTAPAQGWGQDGSGVCSFTQLFNQGYSGEPNASLQTTYHNIIDDNSTLFTQMAGGDPQNQSTNVNLTSENYINAPTRDASGNTADIPLDGHAIQLASQFTWTGATRLKKYAPIKQLFLTLLTFIFVNYALRQLLEVIPEVASGLSTSIGVHLMNGRIRLPFQDELGNALGKARSSALGAAKGKGIIPSIGGSGSKTAGPGNASAGNNLVSKR